MMTLDLSGSTFPLAVLLINALIMPIVLPFIAYYIRKLEKNTNSIKDALVDASRKIGHTEGRAELALEQTEAKINETPKAPNTE